MNKDALFKHVVAMGDKASNFPQPAPPVTALHREGFEKWFVDTHSDYTQQTFGGKSYVNLLKGRAWEVWQAAMRYRDEQEKQA